MGCRLWGRRESDTTEAAEQQQQGQGRLLASHAVLAVKNPPANAGDMGLIPGSGRFPGEGNGNPLQYSRLQNPMDTGAWQATFHRAATSWTRLK